MLIWGTLIGMYGKRDLVNLAREAFDRMLERNLVPWNALIKGYIKVGNLSKQGRFLTT